MNLNTLKVVILFSIFNLSGYSQDFTISKVEPPNWWVGMKWDTVQLMVYGENLGDVNVRSENPALKVLGVNSTQNKSYLFVDLYVPENLQPATYNLIFFYDDIEKQYSFPVLERELQVDEHKGFSNEDVIYLIMADRFCDGNKLNNTIGDSLDHFTAVDIDGRKGGDIEGIISKLDYIKQLGVTAIWITPMLENNMYMSYHGYAATDFYKIDPRFGSNELYKKLVEEAHKLGLKIILDHVSNHIGINHYWVNNLPDSNWFNGTPENFMKASHDKLAFLDVHGDSIKVMETQRGWFTDYMPDLNQRNHFLKKYLIQNTIWWMEYAGIDGIREDTYPYCDQKYESEWASSILDEYSNSNIVGEVWIGIPTVVSGYQRNSPVRKINFGSNLPAVTDFALADAIRSYLGGSKNIHFVYETIAQDMVYSDPDNLLVFVDNHDQDRGMRVAGGNVDKFKIALNLVLFTRGIPTLFYGTEIGIEGGSKDGERRETFPGGFVGDERNAFTESGRTKIQNEIYNYLQELLKLRNKYPVLSKGKLCHIYAEDNIYILEKFYGDEQALIFINSRNEDFNIESTFTNKYLSDVKTLINLKTNEEFILDSQTQVKIGMMSAEIFFVNKSTSDSIQK